MNAHSPFLSVLIGVHLWLVLRLSYEFNVVPEWIAELEAIVAWNLRLLLHGMPRGRDLLAPGDDVIHFVRNVRSRRALHVIFHADVHLESTRMHPDARTAEHAWPRDLAHPE